jgi:hypothetical protein
MRDVGGPRATPERFLDADQASLRRLDKERPWWYLHAGQTLEEELEIRRRVVGGFGPPRRPMRLHGITPRPFRQRPLGHAPRRAAVARRRRIASRGDPPSGSADDGHDRDLDGWARVAAVRMAVRIQRRQRHRLTHRQQTVVA